MVTQSVSGCASAYSAAVLKTVRTAFSVGAIATTGQTICSGGAVTTIGNATAASGGDGAISYQWYRNGSAITSATATTYAPTAYASTVGAQTFTRRAKDGTCNTTLTASTGQWVLTVNAKPTITYLSSGSTTQTVYAGSTITPIKYTTANATGASISGQPAGVSGAWTSPDYTVSGTPSATGTFNYTVTTTNSNGCANVTATGKIVVDPALPPNSGTATWSCGTQVWSGLLRNPVAGCANVTALSTTDPPPAQYKYVSTSDRYYYNWTCVNDAAAALCPSPWRVPTQDDFNELVSCTNYSVLISQWGYGGYALESTISGESANAALWSTTISSTGTAYLLFNESGQIRLLSLSKFYGIQVRCVQ
jgi:hypothetical protein